MVERIKAYAHDTPESIVHLINYKDTTFVLFAFVTTSLLQRTMSE